MNQNQITQTPPSAPAATRHDGWTGDRQRIFIETLADCGVVSQVAKAADMSAQSAYALRRRAAGHGFARAWDAALLLARQRLVDAGFERALGGHIEQIFYHGELVGERVRHDNRLLLAILTRLDRRQGMLKGESALAIAGEFEEFLDCLVADADRSPDDLRAMTCDNRERVARFLDRVGTEDDHTESHEERFERLLRYKKFGTADRFAIPTDDLDAAQMDDWSEEQWDRAEWSGFLDRLDHDALPATSADEEISE